jgi:hypothetical protein
LRQKSARIASGCCRQSHETPKSSPTSSSAVAAKIRSPAGSKRGDRDGVRRHLTLHVERAATPDLAVSQLARPRIELPLARVGEDGVRVREQEYARAIASAGQPGDEIRALRHFGVELDLDAALTEIGTQQLGRPGLVPGRIDRVEADQPLQELGRLVAESEGRHLAARPEEQELPRFALGTVRGSPEHGLGGDLDGHAGSILRP